MSDIFGWAGNTRYLWGGPSDYFFFSWGGGGGGGVEACAEPVYATLAW